MTHTVRAGNYHGKVFIDGVEVKNAIAANRSEGWVDFNLGFSGAGLVTKRIFGYVETFPQSILDELKK